MWFKNLRVFRIRNCPPLSHESLATALKAHGLKPCGRLEPLSSGWTSPYGRDHQALVHTAANCHLLRYGVQEKVLPSAVVQEALTERLAAAKARTGQPTRRREKLQLRDEVIMDLLPKAFVKPSHTDAYLDVDSGWLLVDSASAKRAEDLAGLLRKGLTDLSVEAPDLGNRLRTQMTAWLEQGECPERLDFGDECDLRDDRDAGAIVRCRHQDLLSSEISAHLKAGKRAIKLGLSWAERLAFNLNEELAFGRLRFLDLVRAQHEDLRTDSELQELDAQFCLMVMEFRSMLVDLAKAIDWQP